MSSDLSVRRAPVEDARRLARATSRAGAPQAHRLAPVLRTLLR